MSCECNESDSDAAHREEIIGGEREKGEIGARERESSSHGSHKEAANLFIIAPRK